MDEYGQSGVTVAEICRAVKKRLLWILLATVLFTAAVVLIFWQGINPAVKTYRMDFSVSYPASDTLKYPDGTPFRYLEMISVGTLKTVKAGDERFAAVDVEKMVEKDAVSVTAGTVEENGVLRYTGQYSVTVSGSYFANRTEAEAFLRAVANYPVSLAQAKAAEVSYLLEENVFNEASFEDRLLLLAAQKESLLAQYDEWIELYSERYTVSGNALRNLRARVAVTFGSETQESLTQELKTNGYVPEDEIVRRKEELGQEKKMNQKKIDALLAAMGELSGTLPLALSANDTSSSAQTGGSGSSDSAMDLSETLAALIVRNVQIDAELEALTPERVADFENRLALEYAKLDLAARNTMTVSSALYTQESRVDFATTKSVAEGSANVIVVGVAALVLSFLLASFIVCVREIPKERKKNEAEPQE